MIQFDEYFSNGLKPPTSNSSHLKKGGAQKEIHLKQPLISMGETLSGMI